MSLFLDCPPSGAGQKPANSSALGSSLSEDGRGVGIRPDAAVPLRTGSLADGDFRCDFWDLYLFGSLIDAPEYVPCGGCRVFDAGGSSRQWVDHAVRRS
jgi:hypothetical protein